MAHEQESTGRLMQGQGAAFDGALPCGGIVLILVLVNGFECPQEVQLRAFGSRLEGIVSKPALQVRPQPYLAEDQEPGL